MKIARNGDRSWPGGDRALLDRGYGYFRRGDRWSPDRWMTGATGGRTIIPGEVLPTALPNIVAWFKADSLALADGDPVNLWSDSSGNGHYCQPNVVQPSTAPTFKTNVINGKPVIRFNGTDNALDVDYMTPHWDTPFTYFIVANQASKATSGQLAVGWGDDRNYITMDTSGYLHVGESGTSTEITDTTDRSGSFRHFCAARRQGVPTNVYENGFKVITGTVAYGQVSSQRIGITFTGDVAEWIFAGNFMEVSEYHRQGIEAYLCNKYALPYPPSKETLPVTSGLRVWLKATAFDYPDNTPIPRDPYGWYDSTSGLCFASTQFSAPVYRTNIVNGRPSIYFNGQYGCNFNRATALGITQPNTVICVVKPETGGQLLVSGERVAMSATGFSIYAGSGWVGDTANYSGAFRIFRAVFNGASSAGYVNGTQVFTGNPGSGSFQSETNIGTDGGGSAFFQGHMPEMVIYDRLLSDSEANEIEAFLRTRYNL